MSSNDIWVQLISNSLPTSTQYGDAVLNYFKDAAPKAGAGTHFHSGGGGGSESGRKQSKRVIGRGAGDVPLPQSRKKRTKNSIDGGGGGGGGSEDTTPKPTIMERVVDPGNIMIPPAALEGFNLPPFEPPETTTNGGVYGADVPAHIKAVLDRRAKEFNSQLLPASEVEDPPGHTIHSFVAAAGKKLLRNPPTDVNAAHVVHMSVEDVVFQLRQPKPITPEAHLVFNSSNESMVSVIQPRPCLRGKHCVAATAVENIPIIPGAPLGLVLQEFMLPEELLTFRLHGTLPALHKYCILCHADEVARTLTMYAATGHTSKQVVAMFQVDVDCYGGFKQEACFMPPPACYGGLPGPQSTYKSTAPVAASGIIGPTLRPNLTLLRARVDNAGYYELDASALIWEPEKDTGRPVSSGALTQASVKAWSVGSMVPPSAGAYWMSNSGEREGEGEGEDEKEKTTETKLDPSFSVTAFPQRHAADNTGSSDLFAWDF